MTSSKRGRRLRLAWRGPFRQHDSSRCAWPTAARPRHWSDEFRYNLLGGSQHMSRSPAPALPRRDDCQLRPVRAELAHILASDVFSRSERLSAFLKFVVEQTLDGHGDQLKEHVLAIELYGRSTDFSTAADPIVRVDARRLRDKLREYYASAPHHVVVISMPKGSYTPVFDANENGKMPGLDAATLPTAGEPPADMPARQHGSRLWLIAVAGVLLGSVAWLVIARRAATSTSPQLRLITVTTFPGAEGMPSFSPDGNFVAFNWTGPVFSDTSDVWVKAVDGDALWRLTDTPQFHEALPSWSPDGRLIAFQRSEGAISRGVYLVSPHGGPEQKVADKGGDPSWTPDSRALVMRGRTAAGLPAIFELVLDTGERRQLTSPPPGFVDQFPKVSPDGATLAFARMSESAERPGRGVPRAHGEQGGARTGPSHRCVPVCRAAGLDAGRPRDSLPEKRIRRHAGVSGRRLGWTTASGDTWDPLRDQHGLGIADARERVPSGSRSHMGKRTWAFGLSICAPRQQGVQLPTAHRSATRRAWTCPDGSLATAPMWRSHPTAEAVRKCGWPNGRGQVSDACPAFKPRE